MLESPKNESPQTGSSRPPTPSENDWKIHQLGGLTSTMSYQAGATQAAKASLNPTMDMSELLRSNGQLRVELACKEKINRILQGIVHSAESQFEEFNSILIHAREEILAVEAEWEAEWKPNFKNSIDSPSESPNEDKRSSV